MVPPPGPVTFHTHDDATAARGRQENSANAPTAKNLERRSFKRGPVFISWPKNQQASFPWFCCTTPLQSALMKPVIRVMQVCCILSLGITACLYAEDASINKLLGKLPPPEKIIKPSAQQPARERDPVVDDPLFVYAFSAAYLGDLPQARFYSRKLSEKYPQSEIAEILCGEFAYRQHYYDEASKAFRRATNLAPRDAYAWMELAKAENSLGHTAATVNALSKAADISPKDGELAAVVGFSYINLNMVPQAIPTLQRAAR